MFHLIGFAQTVVLTLDLFGSGLQRQEPSATISSFQSPLQYNYLRAIHIATVPFALIVIPGSSYDQIEC